MTAAKKPVEGEVLPAANPAPPAVDALGALNSVIDGTLDFLRVREEEQTKRAAIDAYATVEVERIQQASSVLKQYFEQVFAERSTTIDGLFRHLDAAMANGDGAATTAALNGIVDLAKSPRPPRVTRLRPRSPPRNLLRPRRATPVSASRPRTASSTSS